MGDDLDATATAPAPHAVGLRPARTCCRRHGRGHTYAAAGRAPLCDPRPRWQRGSLILTALHAGHGPEPPISARSVPSTANLLSEQECVSSLALRPRPSGARFRTSRLPCDVREHHGPGPVAYSPSVPCTGQRVCPERVRYSVIKGTVGCLIVPTIRPSRRKRAWSA